MLKLCRSSAGCGAAGTNEEVLSVCLGTEGRQGRAGRAGRKG